VFAIFISVLYGSEKFWIDYKSITKTGKPKQELICAEKEIKQLRKTFISNYVIKDYITSIKWSSCSI
jgi:hypothetical protein